MSSDVKVVPSDEIEEIVGCLRFKDKHVGYVMSSRKTVYVMHSHYCRDSNVDLRQCKYSLAIEDGIDEEVWSGHMDKPMFVEVEDNTLVPARDVPRINYTRKRKAELAREQQHQ